jgi:TonB family protein
MHLYSRQQKSFYILLGSILFIHALVMIVKLQDHLADTSREAPKENIKIKLVQEAVREMAAKEKKQIVQSEDSESSTKPKEAFLSDKDRHFDRQTVARTVDSFKKAAKGDASLTQKATPNKKRSENKEQYKDLKLSDIGIAAANPFQQEISRSPASEAVKGMKSGDPTAEGLSATNDYVEEMALGDFTHLNTVEYKFYGFFHRIRQKLEQFWGKSIREKAEAIFKSGRRLPASENLITSLRVTLNERGEIVAVKILGASGVKELDDAAIESFNKAGPFPNPPKELLVNGEATIEWGFVVKS